MEVMSSCVDEISSLEFEWINPEPNKTDIANHHFYKVWALKRYLHANNFKCILYRNYCFFLSFTYEVQWSKRFSQNQMAIIDKALVFTYVYCDSES